MKIRWLVFIFVVVSPIFAHVFAHVLAQGAQVQHTAQYLLNLIALANPDDYIVIHNTDGSIRGGAYNISSFGGIFITTLHSISGSRFVDIYKKNYYFYGFRKPKPATSYEYLAAVDEYIPQAEDFDYKWLDLVFMIDKFKYPSGLNDTHVKNIFFTLASRRIRPNSLGFAINGIVPDVNNLSDFHLRTNSGVLFEDGRSKKLYLQVNPKTSSIAQGSSGTLVLSYSSYQYYIPSEAELEFTNSIPIGILKCRAEQSPIKKGHNRFEVQTFEVLLDRNLWIQELTSEPPKIFESDCLQINGRGHGGM